MQAILPYVDFKAGGSTYKLSISAKSAVQAEKQLGCSILEAFDKTSSMDVVITILHASLQRFHSGSDLDTAYQIYDEYIMDGGSLEAFVDVIAQILCASGFLSPDTLAQYREIKEVVSSQKTAAMQKIKEKMQQK